MPDITMCINRDCHLRYDCYRYRAPKSKIQSYAMFPTPFGDDECSHRKPIGGRNVIDTEDVDEYNEEWQ